MGSIPVRVTIERRIPLGIRFFYSMVIGRNRPTQNAPRFEYGLETLLRRLLRRPRKAEQIPVPVIAALLRVLPLGMLFLLATPVVRIATNISSPGKIPPFGGMRNIAPPSPAETS